MARLTDSVRAPGRPAAGSPFSRMQPPNVARALILYITFDAADWHVPSLPRAELDVLLREMTPRELDAYHDWRLAWMYAKRTVHPDPGLEWNF